MKGRSAAVRARHLLGGGLFAWQRARAQRAAQYKLVALCGRQPERKGAAPNSTAAGIPCMGRRRRLLPLLLAVLAAVGGAPCTVFLPQLLLGAAPPRSGCLPQRATSLCWAALCALCHCQAKSPPSKWLARQSRLQSEPSRHSSPPAGWHIPPIQTGLVPII